MSTALFSARELSCERDDRCLFEGLSFDLHAGELLHLRGPNGSGKTTLLRIIAGLYQSFSGSLRWQGEDLHRVREVFLSNSLYLGHKTGVKPVLTAVENLEYLIGLQFCSSRESLYEALEWVGLGGYEEVQASNLSAGQQRRIALARLYLAPAKLWLLDEVFTAIDLVGVAALERFLQAKAEQGVAIIMTTHHRPSIKNLRVLDLQEVMSDA